VSTVTLRNVNPIGEVEIPEIGRTVEAGETFDCDSSVAGASPSGDDLGSGLLAQVGNYVLVDSVDDVPTGSVAEVTEWVGDDPDRATQALTAETGRDHPRKSLVEHLASITSTEETS
jgi:hypothetical protein